MRSAPRKRRTSIGKLPARYSFALNPHADARFTKCPRCEAKTRVRKIPLAIHLDGVGLLTLRKTCRLCVNCELLIAHQAEVEPQLAAVAGRPVVGEQDYFVLGTVDPRVWRQGLSGALSFGELAQHMADFKAHLTIKCTPGGWYPSA